MTPYINPWFFYWAGVINSVRGVLIGVGVLLIIVFVSLIGFSEADIVLDRDKDEITKRNFKTWIALGVAGATIILLAMFIPTKETLYQMGIANSITPNNVENGIETAKSIVDYIVQKVAEMK